MSSEGMERIIDDTMMDSQAEGHVSSSPISSSTVPNGSSASNSSSSNSSRSGDATNQSVNQIIVQIFHFPIIYSALYLSCIL